VVDALILARDQELAGETAAAVAALGFTPRRAAANGGGRPMTEDGGTERLPGVVIVVAAADEPLPGELCDRLREDDGFSAVPVLLAVDEHHLRARPDCTSANELIVRPFTAAELAVRIQRARLNQGVIGHDEIVRAGTLEVNLATYQVTIDGRAVNFTFMEYELLKFLVTHPQRAFSREALLSAVWGYDYYGGARTVDVHIRRVRAKLGPEHAGRIKTVRGVGYRFER
jgi:DNA-binding response OmpR family regulator